MSPVDHFDSAEIELVAGDVLGELDSLEQEKLSRLPAELVLQQRESLSDAAAAVCLMFASQEQTELPGHLHARIHEDAVQFLNHPNVGKHSPAVGGEPLDETPHRRREQFAWLAAAAALLLAVGVWMNKQPGVSEFDSTTARTDLIARSRDVVQIPWAQGKTPFSTQVTGDVVWSTESQEGYMRFVSMPPNDPRQEQYQLWIIDPDRDDEPIDGGVFDISSSGEVIIPIDAKLRVLNPVAFAITIEKPGGVVVSTQERLPLIAPVNG